MKKSLFFVLLAVLLSGLPLSSYSYTFFDDFNDGDLAGWTSKQGDWYNPASYLVSSFDNYGVIWKDDSEGFDQFLQVDAYFTDSSQFTKSAELRLRSSMADGGPNPYFDHGYFATVSYNSVSIYNAVAPYNLILLGSANLTLVSNTWRTLAFSVTGFGDNTNFKFWADGQLVLDIFDTSGSQHDDGGYIALGSSNHINRRIYYDNVYGIVDEQASIPEPVTIIMLGLSLTGIFTFHKKFVG